MEPEIRLLKTLKLEEDEEAVDEKRVLATLDNECRQLALYERVTLVIKYFTVDLHSPDESTQPLILQEDEEDQGRRWCVQEGPALDVLAAYEEAHDRQLFLSDDDEVEDMRYLGEGRELRVWITHQGQAHYVDIDAYGTPNFDRFINKYEGRTIFRAGRKSPEHQDGCLKYLEYQEEVGSLFAFPENEPGIICTLNKEELPDKHFYIYNVFQDKQVRKILKYEGQAEGHGGAAKSDDGRDNLAAEMKYPSDAFDVDPSGNILIYAQGRILRFKSVGVPDSIKKHMAPNYRLSEHKYSPARVQERKQLMKERIDRDLRNFNQLGEAKAFSNKEGVK